jgi:hypothetical protein
MDLQESLVSLAILSVRPGDIVILRYRFTRYLPEHAQMMADSLSLKLPRGIEVQIVPDDVEIQVLKMHDASAEVAT